MKANGILGLALVVAATAQAETPAEQSAQLAQNWETLQQYYPARARKAGEQGLVGFSIRIDKAGQPTNCEVTHTSGYRQLDDETCQLVLIHAKFKPMKDTQGNKINFVTEGVVNWQIPGASGPAVPAIPPVVTAANAPEKMICKSNVRIGTLAGSERTCMTKREWQRMTDEMKEPYDEWQGKKGMSQCISIGGGPCTGG
jgi:TonB family protein